MKRIVQKTKNIPKPTHFGRNIRFLRRLKGLSQAELAKRIGLSRNNVASYESGVVEPNVTNFLKVCTLFDVAPERMLQEIFSEHPADVVLSDASTGQEVDIYLRDQLDQFVVQTNEMTKVYEGYHAFIEMKKETEGFINNKMLYATLEDLLDLLKSLIKVNWEVIQSIFPAGIKNQK